MNYNTEITKFLLTGKTAEKVARVLDIGITREIEKMQIQTRFVLY
jgi:hypothetical protein